MVARASPYVAGGAFEAARADRAHNITTTGGKRLRDLLVGPLAPGAGGGDPRPDSFRDEELSFIGEEALGLGPSDDAFRSSADSAQLMWRGRREGILIVSRGRPPHFERRRRFDFLRES